MNKDVVLTLIGEQTDEDNNRNVQKTKEFGMHFVKNDYHYVMIENEKTAQTARYKFNHRSLEIVRNGDLSSKLHFETGRRYDTIYKTPYGRMELGFETSRYSMDVMPNRIEISLLYTIFSGEQIVSKNKTTVIIQNAETEACPET